VSEVSTRERLLTAALRLFSMHSFAGTSLQMIADNLGVTKAAIYHHFRTRDEILTAVVQPGLQELREVIAKAEAQRSPHARIDALLTGFVDITVRHRALIGIMGTDPGVAHALSTHPDIVELFGRPLEILSSAEASPAGEINASQVLSGIACTASSPLLTHIDDETLREHLLTSSRRLLGLRARHHATHSGHPRS
jgi:AcrR family transcriptional regulator